MTHINLTTEMVHPFASEVISSIPTTVKYLYDEHVCFTVSKMFFYKFNSIQKSLLRTWLQISSYNL